MALIITQHLVGIGLGDGLAPAGHQAMGLTDDDGYICW